MAVLGESHEHIESQFGAGSIHPTRMAAIKQGQMLKLRQRKVGYVETKFFHTFDSFFVVRAAQFLTKVIFSETKNVF